MMGIGVPQSRINDHHPRTVSMVLASNPYIEPHLTERITPAANLPPGGQNFTYCFHRLDIYRLDRKDADTQN